MQTKKIKKKGFTLVELVVVVAVIAVLSAILIPTIGCFVEEAKETNDMATVRLLNVALVEDGAKNDAPKTMGEAIAAVGRQGYNIEKLTPRSSGDILWDSVNNRFLLRRIKDKKDLYRDNTSKPADGADLWRVAKNVNDLSEEYSNYLNDGFTADALAATTGVDVGNNANISVKYVNNKAQNATFVMNGGNLTITDTTASKQYLYGNVEAADVSTGNSCLHVYGTIAYLNVKAGKVISDKGGIVTVEKTAQGTKVEKQNGGIVFILNQDDIAENTVDASSAEELGSVFFAGGNGTKENPYLIENAVQLGNINKLSSSARFYKVTAKEIDCSNLKYFDLYGELDGNNTVFKNINSRFIRYAGYNKSEDETVLKNFTAVMHTPNSLVYTIDGKSVKFENVKVSGYMEGNWNMGAFVNYGTCNADGNGYDYTLNFVNCSCDATIVSKQSNSVAVLVGHTYSGAGKATIKLDSATEEGIKKATLIAKATAKGCKYYGLKYGEVEVYLDGSKVTEQTLAATSIIGKDPVKGTDKYTLALVNGATTVKYQITAQLSAYDENNNKIGNLSGITFNLASVELDVTGKSGNIDLFDLVTSVEIKNELTASGRPEYKTEGGKLIVYTNSTDNYKTGWVSVTASQYRADGVLIAAGTLKLQEIK